MSCKNICKLCKNLVISESVTFNGTDVVINIPEGSYYNCEKVCIIIAQNIPTTATLISGVVVTIGTGTQQYRLVDACCKPVSACSLKTRTKYSTRVETTATSGVFKLLDRLCGCSNSLASINGTAPTA